MPSFHISSSGKLVKCKNDPCKLHAGGDISASSKHEAEIIYEKQLKNQHENEKMQSLEKKIVAKRIRHHILTRLTF